VLAKKVSDEVKKNDVLAYIHANDKEKLEIAKKSLEGLIKIENKKILKEKTILEIHV
jgi:pyrimidine-nucleoside phosphorylase